MLCLALLAFWIFFGRLFYCSRKRSCSSHTSGIALVQSAKATRDEQGDKIVGLIAVVVACLLSGGQSLRIHT